MEYKTAPIGTYIYDENSYSKAEAWDIIVNALNTNKIIICKVITYDKESGELKLIFHGNEGCIRKGHISLDKHTRGNDLVGKAIGVHIEHIYHNKKSFVASRIEVETIAKDELAQYQVGDVVEGIVKKVICENQYAFVDLKEGHCAYLNLKQTSYIPNTACSINEFIKEGEKIKAKVIYVPNKNRGFRKRENIGISLVELEGNFEDRCKSYEINSTYEGIAREDKMLENTYYIIVNQYLYIRFRAGSEIDLANPVKVVIKNHNFEEKCIEAEPVGTNIDNNREEQVDSVGYGCSMFLFKAKGTVSPFAARIGEEWRFETERVNGISMNSVLSRYKNGHLNEAHCNILKIIGILGFSTSKQILSYAYSQKVNLELITQNKLSIRIDSLQKAGLIDISRFEGEDKKGVYRVFNVTKMGRRFLINYLKCQNVIYYDEMFLFVPYEIKKILAVNQFVLACMEKISSYSGFYYHQIIHGVNETRIRTNGTIDFQTCSFFLEAVRSSDNYLEDIKDKLERYEVFFSNNQYVCLDKKNPSFVKGRNLYLILICEDYTQCLEIKKVINSRFLLKHVFFTHDLQVFQGDVEFSVYRMNEELKPCYYSILDLIKKGRECYTEDIVLDNNLSNHNFNSFPEAWLEENEPIWDELFLENIKTSDINQNVSCFNKKEYKRFLETSKIARNHVDSEILWEPKLFFFGSGGAGKTSLIKLLAGQSFNFEEEKTQGVQFFPNLFKNLSWMQYEEKKIENIQVWDFAGQGCDHVLTNFLMTDDALCIIVIDTRKEEYPDEWIRYIQMYAPNAKILLVLNKMDSENIIMQGEAQRKCYNFDFASYIRMYNNIEGIYKISCLCPNEYIEDLMNLENDICKLIFSMENQVKDIWVKGINSLRDWMCNSKEGFIYKKEFIKKHRELGLDTVNAQSTLDLCVKAGICLHNKAMGNLIILKPEWLTSALAKILSSDNFLNKKWQLTFEEIIEIIEGEKYKKIYKHEEGEGQELIDLMLRLEICVKAEDGYIFPCFLPYYSDSKSANQIVNSGNWYEIEVRYQYLPPDIFPKLQSKLWNWQWNILYDYEPDYEPDKGKIIFECNNRKVMAYKNDNSIILALERRVTEEKNLDNDGKEAIRKVREILKALNIEQRLELENNRIKNDKVQEYVIITNNVNSTGETKLSYAKSLLKRICLKGINEQYFPEIDVFYDPRQLLLEEFTIERIKQIYTKYVISLYAASSSDMSFEDSDLQFMGSGFLLFYKEKWFVICCGHEYEADCDKVYFAKIQNMNFQLSYIKHIYEEQDRDIVLFSLEEKFGKYKNLLPEEFLSFQTKVSENDEIYCCGYISEDTLNKVEHMRFVKMNPGTKNLIIKLDPNKKINKHVDKDFDIYVYNGMSGSPIINLENGCIIGMLIGTRNNTVLAMNMNRIWEFVKKYADKTDRKGEI